MDSKPTTESLFQGVITAFLAQLLFIWPTRNIYLPLQDEGNLLAYASRMLDGQLPYGDFFLRFMPGTPFALNILFAVLGQQVWVARAFFILSLCLLSSVIWLVSRRLLPTRWTAVPVLLFLCVGGQLWPMIGYHWDASIPALLALYFLTLDQNGRYVTLAGVLAGLTILISQQRGVAVCLAVGILVLTRAKRVQNLARLVGGAAIPGFFFTAWLVWRDIFQDFWAQAIVFNTSKYSDVQGYPFEWNLTWAQLQSIWGGVQNLGSINAGVWLLWFARAWSFMMVDLVKYTLFLPVLVLGVFVYFQVVRTDSQLSRSQKDLVLGLILLLIASSYLAWPRATRYHFNFLTPMWYPLLVFLLWRASLAWRKTFTLVALVISAVFAVHGVDNWLGWQDYKYPIRFPRGTLYASDLGTATLTYRLNSVLTTHFAGKALFAFPEMPLLVWMVGAKNPTPFEQLIPTYYSDEQVEQAKVAIQNAPQCGILFHSVVDSVRSEYPRIDAQHYEQEESRILELLTRDATLTEQIGGYQIYLRAPK